MGSERVEYLRKKRNERRERERIKKLKLYTFSGSLIVASSLAAQLFCGDLIKPLDAGYLFTSDDVTITNEGDDYHTKEYTVRDSSGFINKFTFDELEQIEPEVNGGYTYIPEEYMQSNSRLGIKRVENNPVREVFNGVALASFIGGVSLTAYGIKEQNNGRRR